MVNFQIKYDFNIYHVTTLLLGSYILPIQMPNGRWHVLTLGLIIIRCVAPQSHNVISVS